MKSRSREKLFTAFFLVILASILLSQKARSENAVDLTKFTATYNSGQILIEWETATELDNAGFFVKRSLQPFPPFEDISGFIPAKGSGVIGASYEFVDNNITEGTNYYYLLEILDTNLNIEYAGPIPIFAGTLPIQFFIPLIQNGTPELTIEPGINFLSPRTLHTVTRLSDGKILIVGGSQAPDQHLASTEIFDPATGSISWAAPLHTARHGHTATLLIDGRVLVVGGYSLPEQWLDDAEVYDPSSNTWTVTPPIYSHGVSHSATLMDDGRVLVVGGCIGSGLCTNRVEIFTPATNTWNEATPLPLDWSSHAAVLLDDGNVLVAGGGSIVDTSMDNQAWLYNPQTNQWSPTGLMNEHRIFPEAVKIPDGRVLLAGGAYPVNYYQLDTLASTEIYDPVSNTWLSTAALHEARYSFEMPLLPDGRILVIGGARDWDHDWTDQSFISEIELYDPNTNQWQIVEELPNPVANAAATLLPDGRVWMTGGQSGWLLNDCYHAETWLLSITNNP